MGARASTYTPSALTLERHFAPLRDTLLTQGDHYMQLADLAAYLEADRKLVELYAGREGWAR
jgi:glycogen phosphorylase